MPSTAHSGSSVSPSTARLEAVTACLFRSTSLKEGAQDFLRECLSDFGARAGNLFVIADNGEELELLAAQGYEGGILRRWERVPLNAPVPLAEAAKRAEAVYFCNQEEWTTRYPHIATNSSTAQDGARAVLPLTDGNGTVFGVLGLSFTGERIFPEEERTFYAVLARLCALGLERGRLLDTLKQFPKLSTSTTQQERRFLTDVLASVTDGCLAFCYTEADLPAPPAALSETPIPLRESADLRIIRDRLRIAAERCALTTEKTMDLLTAVGEAAMNALVHGRGGVTRIYEDAMAGVVQVWIEDNGRGIELNRLSRATLQRGYSTEGSLGHGFYMILESADRVWLLTGQRGTTVVIAVVANEAVTARLDHKSAWSKLQEYTRIAAEGESGALERNRRFIELVARLSPDILFVYDEDEARPIWISTDIGTALGYTLAEIQKGGKDFFNSLLHPDDRKRVSEFSGYRNSLPEGQFGRIEYRIRHSDGSWRWFSSRETTFSRDANGRVLQFFGIIEDATERKRLEVEREEALAALTESERRLSEAQSVGRIGSWELELATGRSIWSPETFRLFGFDPKADVPDKEAFTNRFHPEDRPLLLKTIEGASGGDSLNGDFRVQFENDSIRWLHATCFPRFNSQGQVIGMVGTVQDITERKEQEQALVTSARALLASEERYALAVEGTQDGIWDWDVLTNYVYYSPRWKEILGYVTVEEQELIAPTRDALTERLHPEDRNRVLAAKQAHIDGLTPDYRIEYRVQRLDGSYVWVVSRGRALRRQDGTVYRFAGAVTDITDRKQAEASLKQQAERDRRIAEVLQEAVLPVMIPKGGSEALSIQAFHEAASQEATVGGDFYDCFPLSGDRIALVVGDVIGHGLTAALSIAEVRFALRGFLSESTSKDPTDALRRLNRFLNESNQLQTRWGSQPIGRGGMRNSLVALSVAIFDSVTGKLSLASAGIEPALIARAGTGEILEVNANELILGVDHGVNYRSKEVILEVGDLLVITTDGITEARPFGGEVQFGLGGLGKALTAALVPAGTALVDMDHVGKDILRAARRFAGGRFHDDVCVLIARRNPLPPSPAAR